MQFLTMACVLLLPLLDIASLIIVGERIGVGATLAAVVAGVLTGGLVVRTQGLVVLAEARRTVEAGQVPARALFNGVCVLLGGALLAFPGFVSDAIAVVLLLPPLRHLIWRSLSRSVETSGRFALWTVHPPSGTSTAGGAGPVIEGEFETVETRRPQNPQQHPGQPANDANAGGHPVVASPWRRPDPGAGTDEVVRRSDP